MVAPPVQQQSRRGDRALLLVIPGLSSAKQGRGLRAFLILLAFVAPLVLLSGLGIGYKIPWVMQPPTLLLWLVAATIWVCLYAIRSKQVLGGDSGPSPGS